MVRRLLVGLGVVVALAVIGYASALALGILSVGWLETLIAEARPPIVVGLIHSQTGPLAISEKSLLDAEILALEEINARGGVAGRLLKWEIADGRSDAATFAEQARRLIEREARPSSSSAAGPRSAARRCWRSSRRRRAC